MTPEEHRLIEEKRAANPIKPLGENFSMGVNPRTQSDFYRGGTNDLLQGHDSVLLTHESRHWEKDPLVPYAGCACATCKR